MKPPQAESAAREQFGEIAHVKKEMREVRMMNRRVLSAFAAGLTAGALAATLVWSRAQPMQAQQFYRVGQVGVSVPVLLHEVKPKYTAEAMRAKITGNVLIECVVQPSGSCDEARVAKSLDPGLDRQAIDATRGWRFQPGQRLGKPVPVLVTIEITFMVR
jgi:TonB family protein